MEDLSLLGKSWSTSGNRLVFELSKTIWRFKLLEAYALHGYGFYYNLLRKFLEAPWPFIDNYEKDIRDLYNGAVGEVPPPPGERNPIFWTRWTRRSVFSYPEVSYFPFLQEEKDDFQYCHIKLQRNEISVDLFKTAARAFVQKTLPRLPKDWKEDLLREVAEEIENFSSSKSYNCHTKETAEYWRISKLQCDCGLHYKRSVVPVSPKNYRDVWIPCPRTYYQQRLLDLLGERFLRYHSRNLLGKEIDFKSLHKLRGGYRVMFDIKKCGLTFPFYLIEELINILLEETAISLPFMTNLKRAVYYEGLNYNPSRGTGLGNFNFLTTLALCFIHQLGGWWSRVFNDDSIIDLPYDSIWIDSGNNSVVSHFRDFDIIPNVEKTFLSRTGYVFLEEYIQFNSKSFERKTARTILAYANSIFHWNIGDVKIHLNPMVTYNLSG